MRMVSFNKTKRLSRKEQPFYIFIVDASTSDATTSLKPIAIFNL